MKTILNLETGEIIERELTPQELHQQGLDEEIATIKMAEKAEKEVARDAAITKLAALGLTTDDLKALGL
jgi:hypothetical protein